MRWWRSTFRLEVLGQRRDCDRFELYDRQGLHSIPIPAVRTPFEQNALYPMQAQTIPNAEM